MGKPFRLSRDTYAAGHYFSVTINTSDRRPLFLRARTFEAALACLRESAARYQAHVYAYCFMPDHLHLLASTPEGIRLDEFIRHFKQISSFRVRLEPGMSRLWQPSYYDHALRTDEALVTVADYILNNPVRAGLVKQASDYAYSGSFEWDPAPDGPEGPGLRGWAL